MTKLFPEIEEELVNSIIEQADKALSSGKQLHKKTYRPVRIKYRGNFISAPSGKTVWKKIGDAKNALILSLHYRVNLPSGFSHRDLAALLLSKGLIEYVFLEEVREYR